MKRGRIFTFISSVLGAVAAGVDVSDAEARWVVVLEIGVEIPAAICRVVIRVLPWMGRLLGIVEQGEGAVDGEVGGTPVFVETGEVFHAAAVGGSGRRNIAGHDGRVDGGAGGDAQTDGARGIRVVPGIGKDVHGIADDRGGR